MIAAMKFLKPTYLAAAFSLISASGALAEPSHGLSIFGDLKYGPDFKHFDYVNPNAPRGGEVRQRDIGTFDNLNPFIIKGTKLRGRGAIAQRLPYDTLMVAAADEADALYGLVAKTVEVGPGRQWVEFKLRSAARFHDGSPLTADDIVFSFNILKTEGTPSFRINLADVIKVEALAPDTVRYTFRKGAVTRDLPSIVAGLPILSKAYYASVEFNRTTVVPPLTSGPYRIGLVDQGRTLTYERVKDYWARDLPVNVGRYNFDKLTFVFFRDRTIALQAFKAGGYDFREEFTSKSWATAYRFPAVEKDWVKVESIPNLAPAARQYFVLNLRRDKFKDARVREAFGLAFDFDWTNKNLFYGLYARTVSIFQNSTMAARTLPDEAEKKLLAPYKDKLPPRLWTTVYQPPGEGQSLRTNLRAAKKLLAAAGWTIREGKLVNAEGDHMTIEFLTFSPVFERILAPIVRNLKRLGITASIRITDTSQYTNRMQTFDFDVTTTAFGPSVTPGISERNYWGSKAAASPGSLNYSGISDPVVDALLESIALAKSRDELMLAARALDRVLLWNNYFILQWYNATHNIAYWDRFARPEVKPTYSLGFTDTWWIDPARRDALAVKMKKDN
jgi:microcin C transport system substrate-binding protein